MTLSLEELIIRLSLLEGRFIELERENRDLRKENAYLKQENQHLRDENNRLQERLGLNSSNSSLTTSRDLYKVKKENIKEVAGSQEGSLGMLEKLGRSYQQMKKKDSIQKKSAPVVE